MKFLPISIYVSQPEFNLATNATGFTHQTPTPVNSRLKWFGNYFPIFNMLLALTCLAVGCTTMSVPPLTTGNADSYPQHDQKNGLAVGIQPMTDKKEITDIFKINLLDQGMLPILVVAENKSASDSFIVAKENIFVTSDATGTSSLAKQGDVGSGASAAGTATGIAGGVMVLASPLLAPPLIIASAKLSSDATVVRYNLADKEFYTQTLGPGDKAQGFLYLQFPKASPPLGAYHLVVKVKNPVTGEETHFDFALNLAVPPK